MQLNNHQPGYIYYNSKSALHVNDDTDIVLYKYIVTIGFCRKSHMQINQLDSVEYIKCEVIFMYIFFFYNTSGDRCGTPSTMFTYYYYYYYCGDNGSAIMDIPPHYVWHDVIIIIALT